jgi:hypothetical protein
VSPVAAILPRRRRLSAIALLCCALFGSAVPGAAPAHAAADRAEPGHSAQTASSAGAGELGRQAQTTAGHSVQTHSVQTHSVQTQSVQTQSVQVAAGQSGRSGQSDGSGQLVLSVAVHGNPLTEGPVTLTPAEPLLLIVTVRNNSQRPAEVHSVRMSGAVLGLPFFVYDTSVGWMVPAGNEGSWTLEVPLDDLAGQATGLLPIEIELRGADRDTVAAADGTADVRGSIVSTYGLFGLGLVLATTILWIAVLLGLARHRLPVNRWRRALRFVPAGAGLGLVVVVGLSALRVTAPSGSSELGFLIGATSVAFVLGYLTPTPRIPVPAAPAAATPPGPPGPPAATGPIRTGPIATGSDASTGPIPTGPIPGARPTGPVAPAPAPERGLFQDARGPYQPPRPPGEQPPNGSQPRPEPGRPEPGRPEPGRPEPGRPQPGRPEPGRPQPGRPEPGRPQPGRPEADQPSAHTADVDPDTLPPFGYPR